jgi:hypothetical protein
MAIYSNACGTGRRVHFVGCIVLPKEVGMMNYLTAKPAENTKISKGYLRDLCVLRGSKGNNV